MKRDDNQIEEENKDEEVKTENVEEPVQGESEIDSLKQQLIEADNRYKRALADYQNLAKRSADERGEWIKNANKNLLLRLLPVLDTLLLAAQHSKDKGIEVSGTMFQDALKGEGVEKIETVGKEFDPHLMEAVEIIEGEEGRVIEERRTGYTLYGKLLRAAEVAVGGEKKKSS